MIFSSLFALAAIHVITSFSFLYSMEADTYPITSLPPHHHLIFSPSGDYNKMVIVPTNSGPAKIMIKNKIKNIDPYNGAKFYSPSNPSHATLSKKHIYIASHIANERNKLQNTIPTYYTCIHKWSVSSKKLSSFIDNKQEIKPPMAIIRDLKVTKNEKVLVALGATASDIPFNDIFVIFYLDTHKQPYSVLTTKYCKYQNLEISHKGEHIAVLAKNRLDNFLVHIYNTRCETKHLATYYIPDKYKNVTLHPYYQKSTVFTLQSSGHKEFCSISYNEENARFEQKFRTYTGLGWRCPYNNIRVSQHIDDYWSSTCFHVYKEINGREEKIAELTSNAPISSVKFDSQGKVILIVLTNNKNLVLFMDGPGDNKFNVLGFIGNMFG